MPHADKNIEGRWLKSTEDGHIELLRGQGIEETIEREGLKDLLAEGNDVDSIRTTINGTEGRFIYRSEKGHLVPSTDNGICELIYKNDVEQLLDKDSDRKWARSTIFQKKKDSNSDGDPVLDGVDVEE